jgi:tryptophanyl-tRNA synthetase
MKPVLVSGVQPTGKLHIGNYLGAIKQFTRLQHDNEAIFCIVDLHTITVPQDPEQLRARTLEIAMIYLACGIDPNTSLVFVQSHVPAHAELGWIVNTFTPVGELQRMTQYKDAIAKGRPAFAGLLNYPTLMAADILLYQTTHVPVGEDQLQHIELTRSIAERFNNKYGITFTIPAPLVETHMARILSLANPSQKMAKSESDPNGTIELLDSKEKISKKIKTAVTDSRAEIKFDPKTKPAVSNLLAIFSGFSEKPIKEIENTYSGKGYAEFKKDLAEVVITGLEPIQEEYKKLAKDKGVVLAILRDGAEKAAERAEETLKDVKEKIGLII